MFFTFRYCLSVSVALCCLLLAACNDSSSSSNSGSSAVPPPANENQRLGSVPSGAPPAAFGREPALSTNSAWPFDEGAPRTMGTGRYAHGAYYWTDFIYDASGAKGANVPVYRIGTPSGGSMHYPDENMAGNGADIFIVGLGEDASNTYWRVDWQTLLDVSVPVAAFAIDFQDGGFSDWPGIPRLTTPGIDAVLFISSNGAYIDRNDGNGRQPLGFVTTDKNSRSFVASIPKSELDPDAFPEWRVYLAAGINDGEGGFLDDNIGFRKLPTQPPVFNMAFRGYEDEPALNNFWFDEQQSIALNTGDVSEFFVDIDWRRMGQTEPEPLLRGYSNRWYVSSLAGTDLGAGDFEAGVDRSENPVTQPQYYDRVQPYGIYVPSNYDPGSETPTLFTWMLHSLTQNHNQYSATVPNFMDAGCERLRQSICVTTLGRGPAGSYSGSAEVDFWEVLRDVARFYRFDTERIISSGYSMGAIGTINLMIKYPEVFAGGVVLAGSHAKDDTLPFSLGTGGVGAPRGPELLQNLKWNGYYHAHGTFDELVPFADARATVDAIRDYGYRYTFDHYFAEDHVIWTLKDITYSAYEKAAEWMVEWLDEVDTRKQSPGNFVYRWEPSAIDAERGIGPQGAWWVSGIAAVEGAEHAQISVDSEGIVETIVTPGQTFFDPVFPDLTTPAPALRETQFWQIDGVEGVGGTLTATLENVARLSLDLARARIAARADKSLLVSTTDPVTLTLTGLDDGTTVSAGALTVTVSGGEAVLNLPAGEEQTVGFQ